MQSQDEPILRGVDTTGLGHSGLGKVGEGSQSPTSGLLPGQVSTTFTLVGHIGSLVGPSGRESPVAHQNHAIARTTTGPPFATSTYRLWLSGNRVPTRGVVSVASASTYRA